MRAALSVVCAVVLCAGSAYANAAAGKTHILVAGTKAYWVPLDGGAPVLLDDGLTSVAYDGVHFLLFNGREAKFYDEGSLTPFRTTLVDSTRGTDVSSVVWDGTRFVAAWRRPFDFMQGATLNAQGTVTGTFTAPATFPQPDALASDGTKFLLLSWVALTSGTAKTQTELISGALYDASLARKTMVVSERPRNGIPFWTAAAAAPFGGGFYAAYAFLDDAGHTPIFGRQILADGTLLPEQVLATDTTEVAGIDLVPAGGRLLAVFLRYGSPVFGTFINADGSMAGPQPLGATVDPRRAGDSAVVGTVRLPNGELAVVSVIGGVARIRTIRDRPATSRPRPARH